MDTLFFLSINADMYVLCYHRILLVITVNTSFYPSYSLFLVTVIIKTLSLTEQFTRIYSRVLKTETRDKRTKTRDSVGNKKKKYLLLYNYTYFLI